MKKTKYYLTELVKSNNGKSSKTFALVTITIMSLFLLGICGVSLIVDVIVNGHILTDLIGMAAMIGSIATLLGAVGMTKAYGDKYDDERNRTSYTNYTQYYYQSNQSKSRMAANMGSSSYTGGGSSRTTMTSGSYSSGSSTPTPKINEEEADSMS